MKGEVEERNQNQTQSQNHLCKED